MTKPNLLALLTSLCTTLLAVADAANCSASSFSVPSIFGADTLQIEAAPVYNYSLFDIPEAGNDPAYNTNITSLSFCNVTVTYTHPGRDDIIHVTVWLPLKKWNGRFQGIGGSGFAMSLGPAGLAPVVAQGYAAAATDGGHGIGDEDADPAKWALYSPGNVNFNILDDFASTTLNELAIIGKAVTQSYYNSSIKYSFWNGCSTGGRQGLMLAQRFPDAFDGILASTPLVNWPQTPTATYWAQQVMHDLNYYPPLCELEAIRSYAISVCDSLDGVTDGIISLPSLCDFDARWTIGKPLPPTCKSNTISPQAATIANAVWAGPHSPNGKQLWYGLNRDADFVGVANTTCVNNTCAGAPFFIGAQWIQYFLAKDPNLSFTNMTLDKYAALFHLSVQQYGSIIGTSDPDLSAFRARGGKMITIHGLADVVVPPNSTVQYYRSVLDHDKHAADFYRFYEAPGAAHCNTGLGPWPRDTISVLERWVEHGEVPETLEAVDPFGKIGRPLCPFPKVQRYVGGDANKSESFICV